MFDSEEPVLDVREVLFELQYKQINERVKEMTAKLHASLTGKEKGVLDFLRDRNGKTFCGVCGNTHKVRETVYGETCKEESHQNCEACTLNMDFAYGYSTLSIEGIRWNYSYTERDSDESHHERLKETMIVADIFYRVLHEEDVLSEEEVYIELLEKRTELMLSLGYLH